MKAGTRELPESSHYLHDNKHVKEDAQQNKYWNLQPEGVPFKDNPSSNDLIDEAETQYEHHSLIALQASYHFSKPLRQGNIFLCYTDT